jgi:anti-sigma factor ChrR (cupin superfamily)
MCSFRIVLLTPLLVLVLALSNAQAQDSATHGVVPLHKLPPGQAVEKVWGDPDKPAAPFVIRIHADAGYIILPHTHLVDENIIVVQGVWSLGMGSSFDRSALEQLDVGAFGFAPKDMAHFAWSKTETII